MQDACRIHSDTNVDTYVSCVYPVCILCHACAPLHLSRHEDTIITCRHGWPLLQRALPPLTWAALAALSQYSHDRRPSRTPPRRRLPQLCASVARREPYMHSIRPSLTRPLEVEHQLHAALLHGGHERRLPCLIDRRVEGQVAVGGTVLSTGTGTGAGTGTGPWYRSPLSLSRTRICGHEYR